MKSWLPTILLTTMRPSKVLHIYDYGCVSCGEKQHLWDHILGDISIRLMYTNDCCTQKYCEFSS